MVGQQLKKKKDSELFYEESYTVDKSSKKRQGHYVKIDDFSGDTLAKGHFEQDKQVGVWTYMGEANSPFLTFDYDQNKLIKIANKSFGGDSILVKTGAGFKMTAVDHPAIYLGFKNEIERVMKAELKLPPSVFDKAKSGMVMASFEITEKGGAQNFRIETTYDNDINKALTKSIDIIKEGWFPAAVNGVPVVSKMYMMCNFSFVMGSKRPAKLSLLERADLIVVDIVYFGMSN